MCRFPFPTIALVIGWRSEMWIWNGYAPFLPAGRVVVTLRMYPWNMQQAIIVSSSLDTPTVEHPVANREVLSRAQAEYEEMPGLHLTDNQAARLWACEAESCRAVLTDLEAAGFMGRTRTGAFIRR